METKKVGKKKKKDVDVWERKLKDDIQCEDLFVEEWWLWILAFILGLRFFSMIFFSMILKQNFNLNFVILHE